MARKLSKPEQQRNLDAERDAKRTEFTTACEQWKRDSEELFGDDSRFAVDVDRCVEQKLEQWHRSRLQAPTGKYRDEARLRAQYQRSFMFYVQQDFPHVVDELRSILPVFQAFFGEHADLYNEIFNRWLIEPFFDIDETFTHLMESALDIHVLDFRPNRYGIRGTFRQDYLWGEYRPLLIFLLLRIQEEVHSEHKRILVRLIQAEAEIQPDAMTILQDRGIDPADFKAHWVDRGVGYAIEDRFYPVSLSDPRLNRFFEGVLPNQSANRMAFLELILRVLEWAARWHLEKQWLIRYAIHFLYRLSQDKALPVGDLEVPTLEVSDLEAEDFEFKFSSWNAGAESREEYEERLVNALQENVEKYFDRASRLLGLEKLKKQTKTRKFERVRWLTIAVIENLKPEEVLDWLSKEGHSSALDAPVPELPTVRAAFADFKQFDLPLPAK
ncbi:MAG TPA: hypothetical protein VGO43_13725 [Pyrinomonadaceae bacterium]|jgi:hypothetical protein|nr:hypothetical protein [Pyrinomonadaceae bacterium]